MLKTLFLVLYVIYFFNSSLILSVQPTLHVSQSYICILIPINKNYGSASPVHSLVSFMSFVLYE